MSEQQHPVIDQWEDSTPTELEPRHRHILLTPASTIKPRRVRWLWKDRIAYGTLALLAGREGLGKSTLAYQIAADITRGRLDGEDQGNPRSVLVCATEDSWEHTIVPRLIAASADLNKVYRVEMVTYDHMKLPVNLPRDFLDVEYAAEETSAGLMILDPLMSVIDGRLDTHKDRELRTALEPLAGLADRNRMAIAGLIHHNKSGSTDALQLVMGSKAFTAVARSVHTCIPDPDDETQNHRLFATTKNNLGRLDLPVLGFTITSHPVETEDDGTAWTGRLKWTGEIDGNMHEIMTRTTDPERTATTEAADWLHDYLIDHGGELPKTDIEKAARAAGHNPTVLRRARERLRLEHRSWGFPRRTLWALPGTQIPDDQEPTIDVTEPRRSGNDDDLDNTPTKTTNPVGNSTTAVVPLTPPDPPVVSVASPDDATVTQLDLTWENTQQPLTRVHARAGGDNSTDTTGDTTPLQDPSRVSRVSRGTPPRARHDWTPTPDHDGPVPLCDDCGYPIDTTNHQQTCEAP